MARPRSTPVPAERKIEGNTFYVFSTLTNDVKYVEWLRLGGELPIEGRSVVIAGGTGVADSRLVTPLGVVTAVSEDELKMLEENPTFKLHKANGFITVQAKRHEVESVVADMVGADKSSPLTPSNFEGVDDRIAKPAEEFM